MYKICITVYIFLWSCSRLKICEEKVSQQVFLSKGKGETFWLFQDLISFWNWIWFSEVEQNDAEKAGTWGAKLTKNTIQRIPLVYRCCAFGALEMRQLEQFKQFCRPSLDTLFLCFVFVVSDEQIVGSVPFLSPNRKKHQRKEITNFRDTCRWWGWYLSGTKQLNSRISSFLEPRMICCLNINIKWTGWDCHYKNRIWFGYVCFRVLCQDPMSCSKIIDIFQ